MLIIVPGLVLQNLAADGAAMNACMVDYNHGHTHSTFWPLHLPELMCNITGQQVNQQD